MRQLLVNRALPWIIGLQLCVSVHAQPDQIECAQSFGLEGRALRVFLPLEGNERLASPLQVVPNPIRLLYGTAVRASEGEEAGEIIGGRFLIQSITSATPRFSVELSPSATSTLPIRALSISRDYRYATASSGISMGGPAIVLDLPQNRILRVSNEEWLSEYRRQRDLFFRLFNQALSGDPAAEQSLAMLGMGSIYTPLRNLLEAGARRPTEDQMSVLATHIDKWVHDNLRGTDHPLAIITGSGSFRRTPTISAEVSEDGKRYGVHVGREVIVRETQTATEVSRLHFYMNPYQELPKAVRFSFLSGSDYMVSWHTGQGRDRDRLALWDVKSGYLCDQSRIAPSFVRSLSSDRSLSVHGDYIVLSGSTPAGNVTEVWTKQREINGTWNVNLLRLKTFDAPKNAEGYFRPVDFSGNHYAVGGYDGRIEIYDIRTNRLKKILINGHNAPVHQVRYNALGNQLISVSRNETAIWSLDGSTASMRLEGSPLEPIENAQFIPGEENQILMQTNHEERVRLYLVDIRQSRAATLN
ncbi:MAG: WD40 repeat domain-containing protein [Bdellovibrionota bacterium]